MRRSWLFPLLLLVASLATPALAQTTTPTAGSGFNMSWDGLNPGARGLRCSDHPERLPGLRLGRRLDHPDDRHQPDGGNTDRLRRGDRDGFPLLRDDHADPSWRRDRSTAGEQHDRALRRPHRLRCDHDVPHSRERLFRRPDRRGEDGALGRGDGRRRLHYSREGDRARRAADRQAHDTGNGDNRVRAHPRRALPIARQRCLEHRQCRNPARARADTHLDGWGGRERSDRSDGLLIVGREHRIGPGVRHGDNLHADAGRPEPGRRACRPKRNPAAGASDGLGSDLRPGARHCAELLPEPPGLLAGALDGCLRQCDPSLHAGALLRRDQHLPTAEQLGVREQCERPRIADTCDQGQSGEPNPAECDGLGGCRGLLPRVRPPQRCDAVRAERHSASQPAELCRARRLPFQATSRR